MRLQAGDFDRLNTAIREAFSPGELRVVLRTHLDRNLHDISMADNYQELTFSVLQAAERGDWVPELIAAAHELRPKNPQLQAFAQQIDVGARVAEATEDDQRVVDSSGLERIIAKSNKFLPIVDFRSRLSAAESAVCRVEIPTSGGDMFGTGFLVADDLVMTNYHVGEALIPDSRLRMAGVTADPSDARLRFDFKQLTKERVVNPGNVARLAPEPVFDASPPTDAEAAGKDDGQEAPGDRLDYVVLRTSEPIGAKAIGPQAQPTDPIRGWIPLLKPLKEPTKGDPIIIVQHPESDPMQIAIDSNGVIDSRASRIRYRTNTLKGSSGSPCFDQEWNLVALHHFGDPNYWFWHRPGYNQGIPIAAILRLLTERGKAAEVSVTPGA